ncbi:hypothetical protein AJ78_08931 [Emergomyces pasteurianus Ep9510]|uniref:Uncharacterized protein n=1 Tax=Emergomyces pasteurianus Ep9510 TaxID=1447872 RepID=A0A1J9PPK8_9EURO|nr:hypothetical protein AJ78_08931 [Emergomyces pasteurianus Ep9510]
MEGTSTLHISDLGALLAEIRDSLKTNNIVLQRLVEALETKKDNGHLQSSGDEERSTDDANKNNFDAGDDEKDNEAGSSQLPEFPKSATRPNVGDQMREHPLYESRAAFYHLKQANDAHGYMLDSSVFDSIEAVEPQPKVGTFLADWKYWIPIWKVEQTQQTYLAKGGQPDYIPPWELRLHDDGNLYHIDDSTLLHPLPLPVDWESECHHVPYAFTPPAPLSKGCEPWIAPTGITVDWDLLDRCLGSLYSVPPDGRMPLPFQRNELRLKCASGEIQPYLQKVRILLETLHDRQGKFRVMDFSNRGGSVTYCWDAEDGEKQPSTTVSLPQYWRAARHALFAEESFLATPRPCGKLVSNARFKELTDEKIFEGPAREFNRKDAETLIRRPLQAGVDQPCEWTRIVLISGLDAAVNAHNGIAEEDEAENICKLLLCWDWDLDNMSDYDTAVRVACGRHLFTSRRITSENPFQSWMSPFLITWTRPLSNPKDKSRLAHSSWKGGPLYGSKTGSMIQEAAFTVVVIPNSWSVQNLKFASPYQLEHCQYPTILILAPAVNIYIERFLDPTDVTGAILQSIHVGLLLAAEDWFKLRRHFDSLFDNEEMGQNLLFEPEKHDALLFDDGVFSRSRLYFWVVDSLEAFIAQLFETQREWDNFWAAREPAFRHFEETQNVRDSSIDKQLPRIKRQLDRLEEVRMLFETLHRKTVARREGLFNASSVIESRAATRLGEHVKLLTYISIFYLPLGFSAAIFSINENYSTTAFVITSVLVAVGTYALVVNLENTTSSLKLIYDLVKKPAIIRMAEDRDEKWATKGRVFTEFRPYQQNIEPSEWNLVGFLAVEIWRKLSLWKGKTGTEVAAESKGGKDEESGSGLNA